MKRDVICTKEIKLISEKLISLKRNTMVKEKKIVSVSPKAFTFSTQRTAAHFYHLDDRKKCDRIAVTTLEVLPMGKPQDNK